MATYSIEFDPRAWDEVMALSEQAQRAIFDETDALELNPRPPGVKKLKGQRKRDLYRVRAGDFRVVYEIHDNVLLVLVVKIGDRKDVYKKKR